MYYVESLRGEAGRTLVWLHGAGGNLTQWPYMLRRIPGWRVLTPDLPGHGRSGGWARQSIQDYAQDIAGWLEALDVEQAVIGGHSMGAAIALRLALNRENLVSGLVLLGAGTRMEVNPRLLQQLAIKEHLVGTAEQIAKWSVQREGDPRLKKTLAKQLAANQPSVIYGDFLACSRFEIGDRIRAIRPPALVICGEEDVMMPARLGQELADGLPNAKAVVIQRAGHMVMQERPQEVFALVVEFLASRWIP